MEERIKLLTDSGFVYNEQKRAFIKGFVYIDIDVVQYGDDKLWDKQLKKIK